MTTPDGFWSDAEQVIAGVDKLNACLLQVGSGEPPDWMIPFKNIVYRDEDTSKIWQSNGTSMVVAIDSNGDASSPSLRTLSAGGAAAFGHGHSFSIANRLEQRLDTARSDNIATNRILDDVFNQATPTGALIYNPISATSSGTTPLTLDYTSTGNRILIYGIVSVYNLSGSVAVEFFLRLLKGSIVLNTVSLIMPSDASPFNAYLVGIDYLDNPGSGNFEYSLEVAGRRQSSGGGTTGRMIDVLLRGVELLV